MPVVSIKAVSVKFDALYDIVNQALLNNCLYHHSAYPSVERQFTVIRETVGLIVPDGAWCFSIGLPHKLIGQQ